MMAAVAAPTMGPTQNTWQRQGSGRAEPRPWPSSLPQRTDSTGLSEETVTQTCPHPPERENSAQDDQLTPHS